MIQGRIGLLVAVIVVLGCGGGDRERGNTGGASPASGPGRAAPAASETAGDCSILGSVVYDGTPPDRSRALVVKDVEVCRRIDHRDDRLVVSPGGGIRHAVVTLKGVTGGRKLESLGTGFVLDQTACAYTPHVLLLPKNAALRILNNDGILHNIHTFSTLNKPFNIAQPGVLREIERTFTAPERIGVRCDVHGWMSAWIVVVDHPYHAVTDADGRFAIGGVPPGRYRLECWHESLGERSADIVVAGAAASTEHVFRYTPPGLSSRN